MADEMLPLMTASDAQPGAPAAAGVERMVGEILRIVFESDDGEYVVLRLRDERNREVTLVGPMGGVMEGQDIEANGKWETHKEHGRQFRVESFHALLPTSRRGIERYLASGLIPGIGPELARRIVEKFGTQTLDVLDTSSARLLEVAGVGRKRITQIRDAWKAHAERRTVYIFLQGLGLSPAFCARIFACYGASAGDVVRRNPYRLAGDVRGVGFLTADRVARQLGIEVDNPMRLSAGTAYTLRKLAEDGHVCYPQPLLIEQVAEMLGVDAAAAERGLEQAVTDGAVITETIPGPDPATYIFERQLYSAERELAAALRVLLMHPPAAAYRDIQHGGNQFDILNDQQREAVRMAFASRVSIITGGPGVGKTTVVGQIVHTARRIGLRVYLAAPTGRAAKRLSESCHREARTIHRLLKWEPQSRTFVYNRTRPLRCDLLIVDEVSMLDVELANHLFAAIDPATHVVLVGDRDQLPSVGPGAVLKDLIRSERIPVTHLTEIYRQEEGSRIVRSAHTVNRGDMPDLATPRAKGLSDFYWIDQDDPERVADIIATMVSQRIPQRFRFDPMADIQVLAPMNRGACGAISLNQLLQKRLNGRSEQKFSVGERVFRVNDRVMQVVNNYDKGVFNGELGRIVAVDTVGKRFKVMFDDGILDYDWQESDQIKLAYAVTVHKSQGSEFPVVIMPVLTQHYVMLQRNLIYTGMTRARRLLIMVGTRKALAIAIRNSKTARRFTRLAERLSLTLDM